MKNRLSPATRAAQALHFVDERTGAVTPPVDLAATYARDADYELRQGYIYSRYASPTTSHAEAVLASLEEAEETLLFASGMSAIAAVLETLESGDHIAAPEVMYMVARRWMERLAEKRGVALTLYDQSEPGALAAALRPGQTRILWVETPCNPTWDVTDIAAAAEAAHAAGARLVVDGTVAPPATTRALDLGADLVFHSATKYLNGHSDITGGVLSTRAKDAWWEEIRTVRGMLGGILAPFEAWLLIRGLRTLYLRYERASANALAIARHFEGDPRLSGVLYPGLPAHPGHAAAARQMDGGFGGMLSLLVAGDFADAKRVATRTRLFIPATSLGGVESLIEHRKSIEGPDSPCPDALLRLSVGIEDAADLIADLDQALAPARADL